MKPLHLLVLPFALWASACAYPMYGGRQAPHAARLMVAPPPPPSPTGRWDNVMMLDPGTPLLVLQKDGTRTEGRFHSASPAHLRILAGAADLQMAAADVVRVDRLPHLAPAMGEGLRGAAVGLGTVGVIGLIAGKAPPARHWAAGAIIGGYTAAQSQMAAADSGTIYLAQASVSPSEPQR